MPNQQAPADPSGPVILTSGDDHFEATGASPVVVEGRDGDDFLVGGAGDDTLDGEAGDDYIMGGAGNDVLEGGTGHDRLLGGDGNDVLRGQTGHDDLAGGSGDDVLYGDSGNDFLEGGAGNDTLYGGTGDDEMWGDAGADTFAFERANGDDVVGDFDTSEDVLDLSAFAGVHSLDDLVIRATDEGIVLDMRPYGGGSIEFQGLEVGDLTDSNIVFSEASDVPVFGASSTWHMGSHSADELRYGVADDLIMTLEGNDIVDAGAGNDTVHAGRDDDIVSAGAGDDKLYGEGGDDILKGGTGADALDGGTGDDALFGGAGADTLDGGFGDDFLIGGAGADTFVVTGPGTGNFASRVNGTDTVLDFADGVDRIDLTQLSGIQGVSDLDITADGTTAVIDFGEARGGTLRLEHVDVDDLDASDFIFAEPAEEGF